MKKTTSKPPYKKKGKVNFYLTVYYHISQGLNPSQIARKYKCSESKISYYIRALKDNKLIKRVGYGTWKTTEKQLKNYHKVGGQNFNFLKKVRGHNFQFKIIIPRNIINWDRRIEYLQKNNIPFNLVGNKGSIISINFKNKKIWLCKKSIIIYYPRDMSFFGKSAKESINNSIHELHTLVSQIEGFLGVNLKIKGKYLFKVTRNHYALIKNELAGYYINQGKKIEIRTEEGELWALIDNSYNLKELEAVNPKTAVKDTDVVIEPFMNLLRQNPRILQELTENIILNTKMLKAMQEEIVLLTKFHRK